MSLAGLFRTGIVPALLIISDCTTAHASLVEDALHIRRWRLADGLPQNTVTSVVEDEADGSIWIATLGGLARFDGLRFDVLDLQSEPAIPSVRLRALADLPGPGVLVGGDDGALFAVRESAVKIWPAHLLDGDHIRQVLRGPEGEIVATSSEAAYLFDGESDEEPRRLQLPEGSLARRVALDRQRSLWCGGTGSLAQRADPSWNMIAPPSSGWAVPFPFLDVADDRLRIVNVHGDSVLDVRVTTRLNLLPGLTSPEEMSGDRAAIVTQSHSIALIPLNAATPQVMDLVGACTLYSAQRSERFLTSMVDALGQIWIGTAQDGLICVSRRTVEPLDISKSLRDRHCRELTRDRHGNLWIGFLTQGVLQQVPPENVLRRSPQGDVLYVVPSVVQAIAECADGHMYAGSNQGLFRIGPNGVETAFLADGRFTEIRDLEPLPDGDLLLATSTGLWRWSKGSLTHESRDPKADRTMCSIKASAGGDLWIGLFGEIMRIGPSSTERIGASRGIPPAAIRHIEIVARDHLWIGTYGGGVLEYRNGLIRRVTTRNGLPEDIVTSIIRDKVRNRVWLLGNRGAYRFQYTEFAAFLAGTGPAPTFQGYHESDGMGEGNPGHPGAVLNSDGSVTFATLAGPRRIALPQHEIPPGRPVLRSVRLDGVAMRAPTGVLTIDRSVQRLEINLSAANLVAPNSTHFSYRLIGVDSSWQMSGTDSGLIYTHLPPGRYSLEARVARGDGRWSTPTEVLAIERVPSVFESEHITRLIGVAVLVLVAASYFMIRRRHLIRVAAMQLQLNERTAAEAREHRMLDELDHRVRNNLTSVIAMLALARREGERDPNSPLAQLRSRVETMAVVHGVLSRRSWHEVEISTVARAVIGPEHIDSGRLTLTGDDPILSPRQCQPMALILNELLTNATTHGALSRPTGRVNVQVELARPDSGKLTLRWIESGGPPARRPERQGSGLKLIRAFVEHDLRGTVVMMFEPTGFTAEIWCDTTLTRATELKLGQTPLPSSVKINGPGGSRTHTSV